MNKKTISGQVADEIRRNILTGVFAGGEQLRQEHIAASLGVSRVPVREALHQLHSEGFLTLIPHKGAVVAQVSIEEFTEFCELRGKIEGWLLALAIPNMVEADYKALAVAAEEFKASLDDVEHRHRTNWRFHSILYKASGRPRTIEFLGRLHQQIERYTRMLMSLTDVDIKSDQEHRVLIRLARKRDIPAAVELLDAHINVGSEALVERLVALRQSQL